ncbi:predicted protein [Streptomyces sp. AA4]|nr:predicted protein [Streptomyces sp. AA4]
MVTADHNRSPLWLVAGDNARRSEGENRPRGREVSAPERRPIRSRFVRRQRESRSVFAESAVFLRVAVTKSTEGISGAAALMSRATRIDPGLGGYAEEGPEEGSAMSDVREYLTEVEYPCERDELLRRAAAKGAGDDVIGHLGKLPEQRYENVEAVHRLLGDDVDPHS